ncbi:hypothetical protein ACOSQ2_021650 [Xanthoceras sorbifolium]
METRSSNFHIDLIIEILSRLPVKSLMRFKCVCKSWYTLVKNPYLISKHFKDYNDDNTHLLTYDRNGGRINLFTGKTFADLSWIYLDHHMFNIEQIKGPFNGIFCLFQNYESIILWNPAIRELRKLRNCLRSSFQCATYHCNVGFGLDPVCNDYKLVLIRSVEDYERFQHEYLDVWLYNLRFDFWTQIEIDKLRDYCLLKWQDSTYLSGVCYWLAIRDRNLQKMCVISFNLSNEVFEEIQGPFSNHRFDKFVLGLYNNSLSLMHSVYRTSSICFDLWVMNGRCWTKQLTVGPLQGVTNTLGNWNNGDLLLQSGLFNLLLDDPNTQKIRDFDLLTYATVFHRYKESILTVKLDDHGFDIPWNILGVF